jgi:hypothetical protein
VQVVLAPKSGGLLFVSHTTHFHKPFPWTARLLSVGAVTAQPLAVITKPDQAAASWLHLIPAEIHEHTTMCGQSCNRVLWQVLQLRTVAAQGLHKSSESLFYAARPEEAR